MQNNCDARRLVRARLAVERRPTSLGPAAPCTHNHPKPQNPKHHVEPPTTQTSNKQGARHPVKRKPNHLSKAPWRGCACMHPALRQTNTDPKKDSTKPRLLYFKQGPLRQPPCSFKDGKAPLNLGEDLYPKLQPPNQNPLTMVNLEP